MSTILKQFSDNKSFSSVGLFRDVQSFLSSSRGVRNRAVSTNKILRAIHRFTRNSDGPMTILVLGKITKGYTLESFQDFMESSNHCVYYLYASQNAIETLNRAGISTFNLFDENLPGVQITPNHILQ